ncbi:lysosomal membrane ascorbate-dependent ferrireductase CYB561A3 isoform X1 [Grus americana]|uniref:lysosomal membrane ascorbate-dependent ferrireductase CYB561A3 isoform X1 n=2 Tax=Grus americana TaxID=9117 RepID=UPI002407E69B|nr:lysosomal membrane ascorbate-dependent ferrireductase CYB561A3 isoform X1 [Grus americana]
MEAPGEAEGAAGLRCRHPVAEMLDLPFLPFCILLGGLGFVCVAFVSAWCQHWRGGFALDGSAQTFNWHPVLMVTGMVVLYGAAALVYRLPPTWSGPKLPWKVLHGTLALAAFVLAVLGLVAVFRFHNDHGTPNMYSLHSWLGLVTVLLFSCQWLAGFSAFLLPWAPAWLRTLYKPVHIFFGSTILMLSMASCMSGINEKLFFSLTGRRSTSACRPRLSLPTRWGSSSSSSGCWCWAPWPGRAGSALTPTPQTLASPCSPPSADACAAAEVSPCPPLPALPALLLASPGAPAACA